MLRRTSSAMRTSHSDMSSWTAYMSDSGVASRATRATKTPCRVSTSASVGTGAYSPRPTVTATTCAAPSQRTAPAAYDAKMPGTASPGPVSIHARASSRRTPSMNTTAAGTVVPSGGRRGAH